jgi:hypothetical protein
MMTRQPRRLPFKSASRRRRQAATAAEIEEKAGRSGDMDAASLAYGHRAAIAWMHDHREEVGALLAAALDRSLLPFTGDARCEPPMAVDDRFALRRAAEAIDRSAPLLALFMLVHVTASESELDAVRSQFAKLLELVKRHRPLMGMTASDEPNPSRGETEDGA